MNVLIKKARRENLAAGIQDLQIRQLRGEILSDGSDAVIDHQNIVFAEILRREDACIFNKECCHYFFSKAGSGN